MNDKVYVIFECLMPETFVRGIFINKEKAEESLNILKEEKKRFGQSFFMTQFIVGKIYKGHFGEPKEE